MHGSEDDSSQRFDTSRAKNSKLASRRSNYTTPMLYQRLIESTFSMLMVLRYVANISDPSKVADRLGIPESGGIKRPCGWWPCHYKLPADAWRPMRSWRLLGKAVLYGIQKCHGRGDVMNDSKAFPLAFPTDYSRRPCRVLVVPLDKPIVLWTWYSWYSHKLRLRSLACAISSTRVVWMCPVASFTISTKFPVFARSMLRGRFR